MQNFASLALSPSVQDTLARLEFSVPTPVQAASIPFALEGRDILASAQTGTGKTLAFGVPLVEFLLKNPSANGLVLAPTRELATQVMKSLGKLLPAKMRQNAALLIGGDSMSKQIRHLRSFPRLVVGTPGRINDHLERGTFRCERFSYLVLDEADRMLDMGFSVQIDRILTQLPEQRQTLLFSATMPRHIVELTRKYLNNPQRITIGSSNIPAAKITQTIIKTSEGDKYSHLVQQLNERSGSIIVFVKTKYGTEKMATRLRKEGHEAEALHGDLKHNRRERVIQAFRQQEHRILIATDIAARGLDIPHIEHVINHDLPHAAEDYIHRIGRTARAERTGEAVSLIAPGDFRKWRAIQVLIDPEQAQARQKLFQGKEKKHQKKNERFSRSRDEGARDNARPGRPFGDRKRFAKPGEGHEQRPFGERKRFAKPGEGQEPRPFGERKRFAKPGEGQEPRPFGERKRFAKPGEGQEPRPFGERKRFAKPGASRPAQERSGPKNDGYAKTDRSSASEQRGNTVAKNKGGAKKSFSSHGGKPGYQGKSTKTPRTASRTDR